MVELLLSIREALSSILRNNIDLSNYSKLGKMKERLKVIKYYPSRANHNTNNIRKLRSLNSSKTFILNFYYLYF